MKVLMLSAYHANSHRDWADGLMRHCPDIDWTLLSLPPRHFSWRIRGNSLSWAMLERDTLLAGYDAIVATSMTDLSALKGLVPEIATIPTLLYFHENQFAYPGNDNQRRTVEPAMLNLYSAMAADAIVFNSHYNRGSFLTGCETLLRKLPDFVPLQAVMAKLDCSEVLPVGVEPRIPQVRERGERLRVIWNHRWEYDKGPSLLLAIVQACDVAALPLDFYILGQQFRQAPAPFTELRQCIENSNTLELGHWGYIEDALVYAATMGRCDVVLSTADHDFQGLSVIEAVASGCRPLLPNRLCYPELYGDRYCYSPRPNQSEVDAAVQMLTDLLDEKRRQALSAPSVAAFQWTALAPRYVSALEALCQRPRAGLQR